MKKVHGISPPLDDIWLWLNFDNNFEDSSGNGFDFAEGSNGTGCDTNFGITEDRFSNPNSAIRIANVCGAINVTFIERDPIIKTFDSGLTFSCWTKKISNQPNLGAFFATQFGDPGLTINIYNAFGAVGFKASIRVGSSVLNIPDIDFDYHHWFITIDSSKVLNFWLDKVKVLDDVSIINHVESEDFKVGWRAGSPFNGIIDHVIMYEADHPEYLDTLFDFV